tara:strand:+ start:2163 stop:2729 length:567 start_codon:yes stop_codon:yes gene_type:complete
MHFLDVRNDDSVMKYNKDIRSKPIIVLFYADWCGHCKNLEPIWNEFERSIKGKSNPRIGVSKVNSDYLSKIDGPKDVMGFPTISYIKDGSKRKEYSGPRSVEAMKSFYDELERELEDSVSSKTKSRSKSKKRTRSRKKSRCRKKRSKSEYESDMDGGGSRRKYKRRRRKMSAGSKRKPKRKTRKFRRH